MTWSERTSASRRLGWLAIGLVVVMFSAASNLRAAETQAAAQADPLKLDWDTPGLLIFQVKADRIADFEAAWAGIRAGLTKSAKPGLKEFAATLDLYKVQGIGTDSVYVMRFERPAKEFTYNPVALLYYTDEQAIPRAEADVLFKKWDGSAAIQPWKLAKIGG